MKTSLNIISMANDLAAHAYKRQSLIASNIANADTPGYRAKDLKPFVASREQTLDLRATRPGHRLNAETSTASEVMVQSSFAAESPNGNTVSLEDQMVKSADVKQTHDLALGIYQKSLSIMRSTLGRR